MDNENLNLQQSQNPGPSVKRWAMIAVIALVVIGVLWAIIATLMHNAATGVLDATASAPKAKLSVVSTDGKARSIGTGHARTRLDPGAYQLIVTDGDAQTSQPVTIVKQKTISVSLTIEKLVPSQKLASYHAKSIYAAPDGSLYFINTADQLLYRLAPGEAAAKPYLTNLSQMVQAYWLAPDRLFAKRESGDWSYVHDGISESAVYFGELAPASNVSFNQSGAFTYTNINGNISSVPGPDQQAKQIAPATLTFGTSLAANGTVLMFARDKKASLYQNGKGSVLPDDLLGISSAQWSPDSTKFSYTTDKGVFIYDLTANSNVQVFAGSPSDPDSPAWLTPTTLLYAQNDAIWKFQTNTSASFKIGAVQGVLNAPRALSLSPDGQTVYYGTTGNDSSKDSGLFQLIPSYNALTAQQKKALTQQQKQPIPTEAEYTGVDTLINVGVTSDQLSNLKYAFAQQAKSSGTVLKKISISSVQAAPRGRYTESPINFFSFTVVRNDKETFIARLETSDLTTAHLFLADAKTGAAIYDSGVITTPNVTDVSDRIGGE